jgi:RHS repeat-associated protein
MATRGSDSLLYDQENRLYRVTVGGTQTDYTYNADNARVKKVVGSTATYYIGNWYEVTSGAATKYYYFGAQRVAMKQGSTLTFLHGDHLGSTSVASNGTTGALVSRQTYYAFGGVRTSEGTLPTDYTFTGQKNDGNGLMFYNARYYDATIGRFIQADPIVAAPFNPQSLNRFAYVLNNPVKYIDPSGYAARCPRSPAGSGSGEGDASESGDDGGGCGGGTLTQTQPGSVGPDDRGPEPPPEPPQPPETLEPPETPKSTENNPNDVLPKSISWEVENWREPPPLNRDGDEFGGSGITGVGIPPPVGFNWRDIIRQIVSGAAGVCGADQVRCFTSFDKLKSALGSAGQGQAWHHIIEQRAVNIQRFGSQSIHNTLNVVAVPAQVNQTIANYYSSIRPFTGGVTVRQWLTAQTYAEQFEFGWMVLQKVLNGHPLP